MAASKPSRKRHRDGHPIATDQPDHSMTTDQPDHSMTTDQPDQSITTDQPDQSMTIDQPSHCMITGAVPQIDQNGGDLRLGSAVSMMKRRDLPLDVVRHWEQVEDSYVDIHDTWRFGSVTGNEPFFVLCLATLTSSPAHLSLLLGLLPHYSHICTVCRSVEERALDTRRSGNVETECDGLHAREFFHFSSVVPSFLQRGSGGYVG